MQSLVEALSQISSGLCRPITDAARGADIRMSLALKQRLEALAG